MDWLSWWKHYAEPRGMAFTGIERFASYVQEEYGDRDNLEQAMELGKSFLAAKIDFISAVKAMRRWYNLGIKDAAEILFGVLSEALY